VFRFDRKVARALWNLIKVSDIRNYMLKNMLFEIPLIRKFLFLKDARKIVPSLKLGDLSFAHRVGGIRPQLIDKNNGKLLMGEAKIDTGIGAIFNMTPSPGGTSCVENAEIDLRIIARHINARIYEIEFKRDILREDQRHGFADYPGRVLDDDAAD
jgi:malate dehydrogenase (quinone)